MKIWKSKQWSGFQPLGFIALVIAGTISSASAQRVSAFERNPDARREFIRKHERIALEERQNARAWAKTRGLPTRYEKRGVLYELKAVRNGKPLYYRTFNYNAAISTAANRVRQTAPFNLDGSGVRVGVWDGGEVLTTHQEFGGRVTDLDNVDSHFHATHVGGTIGASGVNFSAKGMAPAVLIDSYDWFFDFSEMAGAAASAPGQPNKVYISNHSYGFSVGWDDYVFGSYTDFGRYSSESRGLDAVVYDSQYLLPFIAAGNDRNDTNVAGTQGDGIYKDGFDTISHLGIAKNVITVGAVNDAVSGLSRSTNNATMSTFSSWGPADDGRIKPDIVANGVGVNSCYNGHNADYRSIPGTSMATPNVCGSAALLVEYFSDLFPGGAMRASTLKGLILHTADDLGRPGPDYTFGWGLMNTLTAAQLLQDYAENNPQRLTEAQLVAGSNPNDTYVFFSDGTEAIRVTLCWTDPEALSISSSDSTSKRLVNDLDIKITGPGGTYYPYKLNNADHDAIATATSENNTDNVEQVYIVNPAIGQYTITVDYDGFLSGGDQNYALLISGISSDSDGDTIPDHWEIQYFSNPTGALAYVDADGDGADNLTEYISGHNPVDPSSVFQITSYTAGVAGVAPYIMSWDTIEGRVYNVKLSNDLQFDPFSSNPSISGDLPYPVNSYTDLVERTVTPLFYQIDVRLGE